MTKKTFSITKIIAAAAAAITTAIVSASLTSYLNSILIVGVSSILAALLSELYARIFRKTTNKAIKVAKSVPYSKILPDQMAQQIESKLQNIPITTTSVAAIPTISTVSANNPTNSTIVRAESADGSDSTNNQLNNANNASIDDNTTIATGENSDKTTILTRENNDEAGVSPENTDKLNETVVIQARTVRGSNVFIPTKDGENSQNHGFLAKNRRFGVRTKTRKFILNPWTKAILIFLSVATTTIALSWATNSIIQGKPVSVTVHEQPVVKLPEAEKQAIENNAINANRAIINRLQGQIQGLEQKVKYLSTELEKLRNNENGSQQDGDSQTSSSQLLDKINLLQAQVNTIKENLASKQSEGGENRQNQPPQQTPPQSTQQPKTPTNTDKTQQKPRDTQNVG